MALCLLTATSCKGEKKAEGGKVETPEGGAGGAKAVEQVGADAEKPASWPPRTLPWMSDDYPAALERARKDKKPIFIDLWAPWCHTCISMKDHVFTDPSLEPYRDRFVWLEIDTDKPQNREAIEKFPPEVWPTFYVVSTDESIQARHFGANSVSQMRDMLDEGERGHRAVIAGEDTPDSAAWAAARAGDLASMAKNHAEAEKHYRRALELAPDDWGRNSDVVVMQIAERIRSGNIDGCIELGQSGLELAQHGHTSSVTDFAQIADSCADVVEPARATALRGKLVAAIVDTLEAEDSALSIDDQADALRVLREISDKMGNTQEAQRWARKEAAFLDAAAADSPTPWLRVAREELRVEVYMYLGEEEKLLPDLVKLLDVLPEEYDPFTRYAQLTLKRAELEAQGKQLDHGEHLAQQALDVYFAQHREQLLELLADVHARRGDEAKEKLARDALELVRAQE